MLITAGDIGYGIIKKPTYEKNLLPVDLDDKTMEEHKYKAVKAMEKENLDLLVIYADREHGANFAYLTGFEPRFEEAVLVLHRTGKAYLMLGNESVKMVKYSRIKAELIHTPYFSLPNQPMETDKSLKQLFEMTGIKNGMNIGVIGWKMFTGNKEVNDELFDVPEFIMRQLFALSGNDGRVTNRADLFISPEYGIRTTVNANEIAHYEFGAALASECMLDTLDRITSGITELELATSLQKYGQPTSVQTICAAGERFTNAVIEPRASKLKTGDPFSATIGYKGGLTSRAGYVVMEETELNTNLQGYLDKVVKPYYAAAATWYTELKIGMKGKDIYRMIETVIPKDVYRWNLNPGHLIGSEEWMSSPFRKHSEAELKSGMMLQMDIIINVEGFGGINAEDGVVLADQSLREELQELYPEVWKRISVRQKYMKEILGISIKDEVLPLSDSEGYLRPFLLNKDKAMYVRGMKNDKTQ